MSKVVMKFNQDKPSTFTKTLKRAGWQEVKLGEVTDIGSSKRIFYNEYVNRGVPFYRSKEIIEKYNGKDISTRLYISNEKFLKIKRKFGAPSTGDILLTSVGTLGIPYIVKQGEIFYFKDGNLVWFKNFTKNLLNRFLYYWIISPIGKGELQNATIGSTQSALTIQGLNNLKLILPPLPEQKAIAEVLSSIDDKIYLLHRQNKTLEDMAQTLVMRWFIHTGVENNKETEMLEEIKLSDLANHKKVNIKPSNNPETYYYHYNIPSFDNSKTPIKELGKDIKSNKYKVFEQSILVSKLNPRFPRVWPIFKEIDNNAVCSTEFQVVQPKNDKAFGFIYCFLKSKWVTNKLISSASGTSGRL